MGCRLDQAEPTSKKKRTRRARDPEGTRASIPEAARTLLAKSGAEGLSVSQVAQLAGVNRGTAYQHFQTREQLLEATATWVSEKLCSEVFGDTQADADNGHDIDAQDVAQHLVQFAMENPELGRVWLFQILNSSRPSNDPFWRQFKARFERFAQSEGAQPGIDIEVHTVAMLAGAFIWPVWARAHARSAKERGLMADRFSREMLRFSLNGTIRPDSYPKLEAAVNKVPVPRKVPGTRG